MATGDVYRAQINMQCGSTPTMNVLHLRELTGRGTNESGTENVVSIVSDFYNALKAQLAEGWRVISIRANQVHPASAQPPDVTVFGGAESIEGAIVSDMVPSNAPLVISLYSSVVGRRGRGRIYLPGVPETMQDDGQITSDYHADVDAICEAHLDELKGPVGAGTGTYEYIVWNPPGPSTANMTVQQHIVRPNLANMRSRRAFEGFSG